jgi:DNA replication protein DnaC
MSASHALDQQRDNALQAILKESFEADRRLLAIAEVERRRKREAEYEERMRLEQESKRERLMEEIGAELVRDLDPEHPDFDGEAFEQMRQCKSAGWINFNFLLYGPTGTGKSRAMAHFALKIVEWCYDCAWVDSATFAGLVTACAPDASSAQRKEARAELKRLAEVEFLFFDDLGAVRFTDSRITHFYALMQARYKHNLTTYFTTNYDREGIEKMLTVEGTKAEAETAGRIIRRMIGTPAEPRAHLIRFKRRKKATKKEAAPVC